jgi:hypothetical protein
MYKPSTYLVVSYFPTYLPIYETYIVFRFIIEYSSSLRDFVL